MLQLVMVGNLRPFKGDVSETLVKLWMAVCLLCGSWVGLTKHEVDIIALPFGWLSARTAHLACLKKGIRVPEVSEGRGRAMFVASMVAFLAVYVKVLGITSDMIVIVLFVEAGWSIWKWLFGRSVDDKDAEKGDGDVKVR